MRRPSLSMALSQRIMGGTRVGRIVNNLLSANAASLETDASAWILDLNATIARSLAAAADGVASLAITSAAAGDAQAKSVTGFRPAVTVGSTYTARAEVKSATVGRNCAVGINWYTAGNSYISTTFGTSVPSNTSGFVVASLTSVAPATAGLAAVVLAAFSTGGAAEVHYFDKIALYPGSNPAWTGV